MKMLSLSGRFCLSACLGSSSADPAQAPSASEPGRGERAVPALHPAYGSGRRGGAGSVARGGAGDRKREAGVHSAAVHPNSGQATYALMMNVRAYLALADAVPKPFPFPEAARQQFAEVRDDSTRLDSHFRALLDSKDAQLTQPDRDNLARYAEANRKLGAPQPGKPRVVFLGDSITDLWRLNEYFPDRDFVNRGISGQIACQMLGRMKADVIDLHPAAVVILAGTNDLARGIPLTAIEDNYVMMADLAAPPRSR